MQCPRCAGFKTHEETGCLDCGMSHKDMCDASRYRPGSKMSYRKLKNKLINRYGDKTLPHVVDEYTPVDDCQQKIKELTGR
jgi:hypothetical protein